MLFEGRHFLGCLGCEAEELWVIRRLDDLGEEDPEVLGINKGLECGNGEETWQLYQL
jgi:hypothetical protein